VTARRGLSVAVGALVLAMLTGCAGVPAASAPRPVERISEAGSDIVEPDIRYRLSPRPGESPYEIVQDFLTAAGSPEGGHRVARQFLTPEAADTWADQAGGLVLQKTPYIAVESGGTTAVLRGELAAVIDPEGSYSPARRAYSYRFRLEKVSGEWRVANPPDGLLVTAADFPQFFRRLNAYYLDPTETRVVPDPRWFAAPKEALPNALLNALLDGPSAELRGAVLTELGANVALTSNVVPAGDRARVSLRGLGDLGAPSREAAIAQIVWTLTQLGFGGVEIYDNGQLVDEATGDGVQRIGDWRSYDPDTLRVPTPGFFIHDGAVWTTDEKPVRGDAGRPGLSLTSVGVSRDMRQIAVVGARGRGARLYVGSVGGSLASRLDATSLTAPTWGAAVDEVWTVQNGSTIIRVPRRGEPAEVSAPDLEALGPVRVMRVSRDGCRVAFVAGPRGRSIAYVGIVTRGQGTVSVAEVRQVAPRLAGVLDVAWSSADTLTVIAGGGSDAAPWSIGIDGSIPTAIPTSGLPGPPASIAAARDRPALAVANGGIWRREDDWVSVSPNRPISGTAPAYPG
jgi:Lipoprotein LpqB beta-propeller domain/Sporulation and spore germination